jgi:hypothetical protein
MSKRKSELCLTPTKTYGAQYQRELTPDGCDKANWQGLLARRRQTVKKSRDQLNANVVGEEEHAVVVVASAMVIQDHLKAIKSKRSEIRDTQRGHTEPPHVMVISALSAAARYLC